MIKVEVKSADTSRNAGMTKTGKPYPRKQEAWVHLLDKSGKAHPYPVRVQLVIWDDQEPHAPGTYVLADQSIYADKWDELCISPVLVPVAASAARAA